MNRYLVAACLAGSMFFAQSVLAEEPLKKTVESVNKEQADLKGKMVQIHGKVVKVNNGIMKRNFLHIQDGTGGEGTNDITITSNETAKVGDEVTVTGTVALNVDFGFGYMYPILIEQSKIDIHQ